MNSDKDLVAIIDGLKTNITEQAELRLELIKINVTEKVSKGFAQFFAVVIAGLLFLLSFFFFSIMLGFYLSKELDSYIWGFGIVALAYLLFGLLIGLFKKQLIITPITNNLIKLIFSNDTLNADD